METHAQQLSVSMERVLSEESVTARDRRLFTELMYGVTRWKGTLDYLLDAVSRRPMDTVDARLKVLLRLGAYQLEFLTRVPASAAVNESVKLTKTLGMPYAAGYVNAVLRNLERRRKTIEFPDSDTQPAAHLAARFSYPEWLTERWIQRFGFEEAAKLCDAGNQPGDQCIRTNTLVTDTESLRDHLESQGYMVNNGLYAPDVLYVRSERFVLHDPWFGAGAFYLQDEASALVAHAVAPRPFDLVYDLCSAPGGKTTHLAQLMQNKGRIVAGDRYSRRLSMVRENAGRLGVSIIETVVWDATQPLNREPADRVLVDAPCSGFGALRQKPDIRWNRQPEDVLQLAAVQAALLVNAARCTAPGGLLVYATCTTEREENEDVIRGFLAQHPHYSLADLPPWFPKTKSTRGTVQFFPHRHGIDGFYIAVLKHSPDSGSQHSRL